MNYLQCETHHTTDHAPNVEREAPSISAFVLHELPHILTAINNHETTTSTPAKTDLLLLDCLMMERALIHAGAQVPEELITFIEKLAKIAQRLPTLTYEDLIMVNPLTTHPRMFSSGEVANSERNFYRIHATIEHSLETAIELVVTAREVLKTLGAQGATLAVEKLKAANHALEAMLEAASISAMLTAFPPEHFASFRKYLTVHPTRGFKGPSGAFSGNLPLLELNIAGQQLPPEFIRYLAENIDYFPRHPAIKIKEKMERLQNPQQQDDSLIAVNARTCTEPTDTRVKEQLAAILEKIREFRGLHYKMIKHYLPGALPKKSGPTVAKAAVTTGTAGESDVHTFLIQRLKMRFTP